MDKDNWTIWKKIGIALEASVGIFVIWLICTVFTVILTIVIMQISFGGCTAELLEEYQTYIKVGYGTVLTLCIAYYVRRLYRKYNIKE